MAQEVDAECLGDEWKVGNSSLLNFLFPSNFGFCFVVAALVQKKSGL